MTWKLTANLLKNQMLTAPAIIICWHPMMNCVIQIIMNRFHHRENWDEEKRKWKYLRILTFPGFELLKKNGGLRY